MVSGCQSMSGYVMNSSGQNYYQQGNYQAAASEFQQAMMAEPRNPDYIANLAKTRSRLGDTAGAEQLYRQALVIAPSHQPSYHGMAEVLMAQGRPQEAAGLLQTWASTQPYVPEAHLELAWLQREMGQPDQAAQSLQHALQLNPGHTTALAHMGQYYQDMGRPDQAVAMYQQSLRADWNQPEVHSRMASAAQMAGDRHPMSTTAMARGVHPYSVPRQPGVFGPPSQGAQLAQMQMQQMQMAQAQSGMMAQNPGPAFSFAAMNSAPMMAQGAPLQQTAHFAGMPAGQQTQQSLSPGMVPPEIAAAIEVPPGGWQMVPGSLKVVDSGSSPTGSPSGQLSVAGTPSGPVPQPDPGFAQPASVTPVQSVSSSATVSSAPEMTMTGDSAEVPVLEAF